MTTTTEDIMKLAFNASHAETEHSADKWLAQLRTAVEDLVAERDELRAKAEALMPHVEGTLPIRGWLRDNDASRRAIHELRAALRGQP